MRNTAVYRVDKAEVLGWLEIELETLKDYNRAEMICGDMGPMILRYVIEYISTQNNEFQSYNSFERWLKEKQDEEYGQTVAS